MSADESTVPGFNRGSRLSHDKTRDRWVVLAPEKLFVPDATALAVLELVDGRRTLGAIVDALAARFDAPRQVIADDVLAMVDDLAGRKVLRL